MVKVELLVWIKDIAFILLFLAGTLWMWGWVKLGEVQQQKLEFIFRKSRTRFKWLFLVGLILLIVFRLFRIFWPS